MNLLTQLGVRDLPERLDLMLLALGRLIERLDRQTAAAGVAGKAKAFTEAVMNMAEKPFTGFPHGLTRKQCQILTAYVANHWGDFFPAQGD